MVTEGYRRGVQQSRPAGPLFRGCENGTIFLGDTDPGTILITYEGNSMHWSMTPGYGNAQQITGQQQEKLLTPSPTPDC